jgi:hypothetical protein
MLLRAKRATALDPIEVQRKLFVAQLEALAAKPDFDPASLTEEEMKQVSAKSGAEVVDAAKTAAEREARRIIRARR